MLNQPAPMRPVLSVSIGSLPWTKHYITGNVVGLVRGRGKMLLGKFFGGVLELSPRISSFKILLHLGQAAVEKPFFKLELGDAVAQEAAQAV